MMTFRMTVLATLLMFSMAAPLHAATGETLPHDFGRSGSSGGIPDTGHHLTTDLLIIGAAGSFLAYGSEAPGASKQGHETLNLDTTLEWGNAYGSGWGVGGFALLTLAVGEMTDDPTTMAMGRDLTMSFAATAAVTGAIKYAVDRVRPDGDEFSFPSGHTSGAFSSVPVVWEHLGWEAGATIAALATCTGIARIETNRHYLSDVIAGAALGLAVGRIVSHDHDGWRLSPGPTGLTLTHPLP